MLPSSKLGPSTKHQNPKKFLRGILPFLCLLSAVLLLKRKYKKKVKEDRGIPPRTTHRARNREGRGRNAQAQEARKRIRARAARQQAKVAKGTCALSLFTSSPSPSPCLASSRLAGHHISSERPSSFALHLCTAIIGEQGRDRRQVWRLVTETKRGN